jgi:hypothetical protein
MTSVTYAVVGARKKAESEDYDDRGTNFYSWCERT